MTVDEESFWSIGSLPPWKQCKELARRNMLRFGDASWRPDRSNSQYANCDAWIRSLDKPATRLVIVEIGAGTAIPSVRMTSEKIAELTGGTLIRINPHETEVPRGQLSLPLNAAQGLQQIFRS